MEISKINRIFKDLFHADLRSLAALRVGVGLLLIYELLIRVPFIEAFYTDRGLLPLSDLFRGAFPPPWTLHAFSGSFEFQLLLFIVSIIFAAFLLAGYKTKFVTIVSFILLVSLDYRNIFISTGEGTVLRVVLFWGIFLPWGARFSIDSIRDSSLGKIPDKFFSFGALGYFFQICFIYFFASLHKGGIEWATDYSAVFFVLKSKLATSFGQFFLNFPFLSPILTFSVKWFEFFVPVLLFFPFKTIPIRLLTILAIVLMQISFNLSLDIGLFPLVNIVVLVGLLPSEFWDYLFSKLSKKFKPAKIYYDSDCGLCEFTVRTLKRIFLLPSSEVLPAFKDVKINSMMQEKQSWVVVNHKGHTFLKSKGFAEIIKSSPLLFYFYPVTQISGFYNFGDKIYDYISKRRHSVCKIPRKGKETLLLDFSKSLNILAVFFILYIFMWNISGFQGYGYIVPDNLKFIGFNSGIFQRWNMFVPPPKKYEWHIAAGKLEDGSSVNLLSEENPLDINKPPGVYTSYGNNLWRKMLNSNSFATEQGRFRYFSYMCYVWNAKHNTRLEKIELTHVEIPTGPEVTNSPQVIRFPVFFCP